jgi:hypothetical protein
MDLFDPQTGSLADAIDALLDAVGAYDRAGRPFGPTFAGLRVWVRFRRTATTN